MAFCASILGLERGWNRRRIVNIHEYQARELYGRFDIPTKQGVVATTASEAEQAARAIGGPVVIKAQVLTGGRGKAGGIKIAHTPEEARAHAGRILGMTIKTFPVRRVLVVPALDIRREFYVGLTLDRTHRALVLMLSAAGGMDIEEVAEKTPDAILTHRFDPLAEYDAAAVQPLVETVFGAELAPQAAGIVRQLHAMFMAHDCSLVEINPLAVVDDGTLMAMDGKITFDENGLFRHPEQEAWRDPDESSEDERLAREANLSFVSMDGDIGCIVNGAGLAMATMDLIKHAGGQPANFLDVGGSSNPAKVLNALKIILRNPRVKAILINIFGGITRCDDIAQGILMAVRQIAIPVPMVIRLIGTNDGEGRALLAEAGLTSSEDLTAAVRQVVVLGREGARA